MPLVSLAMSSVLAHIALLTGPYRAEESAADAVAALVFGQVLTPATVARLRREEGSGARVLPAFLSTHPRPHRRRAAVLRLLDQVDHQ